MIIIRNPARARPLSNNVKRLMRESRASKDTVNRQSQSDEKGEARCTRKWTRT